MICTLGSFCPRMSAKIRLLVMLELLSPLQPEHVPFNGTSDQTPTSINQLISQESKLNMLEIQKCGMVAVTFLFYNLPKCFANLTLIARTLFLNKEVVLHFVN